MCEDSVVLKVMLLPRCHQASFFWVVCGCSSESIVLIDLKFLALWVLFAVDHFSEYFARLPFLALSLLHSGFQLHPRMARLKTKPVGLHRGVDLANQRGLSNSAAHHGG